MKRAQQRGKRMAIIVGAAALVSTVVTPTTSSLASVPADAPPLAAALPLGSGTPNLNAGIDTSQRGKGSYEEELSLVAEDLTRVRAAIEPSLSNEPGLVEFGFATGTNSLVVYWNGPATAVLGDAIAQAESLGANVVVAPRAITLRQLEAATTTITKNREKFKSEGIDVIGWGGFSAEFDGAVVTVESKDATTEQQNTWKMFLERHLDIPVLVQVSPGTHNFAGKYDDSSPYYGGGAMVSSSHMCTTGFGVRYGSSQNRYMSARHCDASLYETYFGQAPLGSIQQNGSNGVSMFSSAGSYRVFDGPATVSTSNTSSRLLNQRQPNPSQIGLQVCHQGANMGQKCGTLLQAALFYNDGQGQFRTNYVRSDGGSFIAGDGDSGAPVVSLHTGDTAWAVGILQGSKFTSKWQQGGCPGANADQGTYCTDDFFFTNVDYAVSGLSGVAIRYG